MSIKQLDITLRNNTLDFMGVKQNIHGFNISVAGLCCILLIKEREDAIASSVNNSINRYTNETLLDELLDIGVSINEQSAAILHQIEQEDFIFIDEMDKYHAKKMSSIMTQLFDWVYPTMKGLLLVAYFTQTAEEVFSDRKTLEDAVNQVDQVLKSQGVYVDLKQLSKSHKKDLKKLVTATPQGYIDDTINDAFTSVLDKREAQFAQTVQYITAKVKEMGGLPVLEFNSQKTKQSINKITNSISDIADIILSDVGMTVNFLKMVNQNRTSKSVLSISHAIMLLGYEQLKQIINNFNSLDIITDTEQKIELEAMFLSSYMGRTLTKKVAEKNELKDVEEIVICSMLHNLGQLIVLYYYPEAYFKIRSLMEHGKNNKRKASREILGATYDNIGIHFALQWNFPFITTESLRVCYFNRVGKTKENLMINLPFCSSELCAFSGGALDGMHKIRLRELINSLNMFSKDIRTLLESSWKEVEEFSKQHNITVNKRLIAQIASTG